MRVYKTTKSSRSRARKLCHQRSNGKCAICQRKEHKKLRHEVHHIKPVSQGGSWEQENLVLLCTECHRAIHRKEIEVEPEHYKEVCRLRKLAAPRKVSKG